MVGAFLMPKSRKGGALWREVESRGSRSKLVAIPQTNSLSRFARNTLDCLKYIRQLKDKNIPVFFEKEAINTMDAKGEVLITIMASLAQQES